MNMTLCCKCFLLSLMYFVGPFLNKAAVEGGRVQQLNPTRYVVAGEDVTLPCSVPGFDDFLVWKFTRNGSDLSITAGHIFPGGIKKIFGQFDVPPGRASIVGGKLVVTSVAVADEGEYWCEISSPADPAVLSDKHPVHVWVTPQTPTVARIGNRTITEYEEKRVARCSSQGGKPGATLTWMNGSTPIVSEATPHVVKNGFADHLTDVSLDLVLTNPTRFDHRRPFHCRIEHPAYKGLPRTLNYSVNVQYHPVNIRIWTNLTILTVYCEADGFPPPKYHWFTPGDHEYTDAPQLLVPNLMSLPGYQFFECTADNGIPPAANTRILVDDLIYPDGKPGFLGLDYWIWGVIGGGVLLLIIIVIVVLCCYCKRKQKKNPHKSAGRYSNAKYSKPRVDVSGLQHSQPSLLELDARTPDGRESSRASSEFSYQHKGKMKKTYSLERLVEEKYGDPTHDHQGARQSMYADTSLQRRASREEIDKVADHIEVLSRSWDHLARSRDQLDRSRGDLHVDMPPRYQSQVDVSDDQQYGEERRDDQEDRYPYMDDTLDRQNASEAAGYGTNQQAGYDYHQEPYDQQPYDDQQQAYYDDHQNSYQQQQEYGHQQAGYDDRSYNQQQRGYDDERAGYDVSRNGRAGSYDSEFDDYDQQQPPQEYGYDRRGYQRASMI